MASQFSRTYREQFQRNERVRQSVENAREGIARLAELNEALNLPDNGSQADILLPRPMSEFITVIGGVAVGTETPNDVPVRRKDGDRGNDKKRELAVYAGLAVTVEFRIEWEIFMLN